MRDVKHESLQHESPVEIIPVPVQKELPTQEKTPPKTSHERPASAEKARHAGVWRFILAGGALFLVAALLLVYFVLPRPQPSQQPAHPGSPAASTASISTPSSVSTDFSTNITVVNGVAYASSGNGAIYALRPSNGSVLWRQPINASANGAPLVDNGIVYIIAESTDVGPGSIYALRASDGAQLWRYNSSDYLSALTIANGIAYVTTYDVSQNGSIIALRANNGAQLWHDTTRGSSANAPIVDNGIIYISANANNGPNAVYALQASDGAQLWRYSTKNYVYMLTVANGMIGVFSDQGLAALQANNGHPLWSDALAGNFGPSAQLINGVLYFTTTKVSLAASAVSTNRNPLSQMGEIGNMSRDVLPMTFMGQTMPIKEGLSSVYAVRVSDGAVLWHYQMSKEYGNNWANWLSLANGTVYIGTYVNQDISYIYALRSSDGSLLWRQATNQGMVANAFVANGVIYLASYVNNSTVYAGSGAVYALLASDGARLWYHPINWVVNNPPILLGTTLYVTTAADDVYAFRASNGSQLWHIYMNAQ